MTAIHLLFESDAQYDAENLKFFHNVTVTDPEGSNIDTFRVYETETKNFSALEAITAQLIERGHIVVTETPKSTIRRIKK